MSITTLGKFLAGGLLALSLGGCMMAVRGVGGTGEEQTAKVLTREIAAKDLSLSLEAPPISAGRETRFILKLARLRDGKPVTGAAVAFIIEREGPDGGAIRLAEQASEEIAGKGLYQLHYKFRTPGRYKITASAAGPGEPAAQAQSVSLTQEISKARTSSLWFILGAAAVLAVKFLVL
ncbi:MAG: hypothetical protein A2X29_09365 [Elusimicrobia bacterium GWA2_64_40]|nr:MAG: hypothetical protein A2X29_09365 [Elusimicrobia bacterium GWA2_64_40]OGR66457.1 MAG: hypothetical protein A2X30_04705 [Elusimicrobia bacterium GWB2_63_16]HAN03720.1 hypothetical protein [Elusimicrobiota bacterium]